MTRLLLSRRGRAAYPERRDYYASSRRGVVPLPSSPHPQQQQQSWFSRQTLVVLMVGILFGYLLLPVLLVQRLPNLQQDMETKLATSLYPSRVRGNSAYRLDRSLVPNEEEEEEDQLKAADDDEDDEEGQDSENGHDEEEEEEEEEEEDEPVSKEEEDDDEKEDEDKEGEDEDEDKEESEEEQVEIAVETDELKPGDHIKRIQHDQELLASQSLPTATTPKVMRTNILPDSKRKKILVTGGAGFVGSHLVDKLMIEGHEVTVLDNFFTGQKKNIAHWLHHPNFSLVVHDVTEPIMLEVDQIYHLACPASPPHYQYNPVKTIKTSTMGTINMLGLAKRVRARILLSSTSEIYGDPQVHPQPESYWGNVNTIGPRACYDEGKRVAETMMYSYKNQNQVDVRVARIFNTFGPRMHPNDGRVVSNFIIQALQNKDLTIYGKGKQTRSFQYVSDLVNGLHSLMNGGYDLPVNLGNPEEFTIGDFAKYILKLTKSKSKIVHLPASQDDPTQRNPDISTAEKQIKWQPKIPVEEGLDHTIDYFSRVLDLEGDIIPTGPGAAKPEA